MEDHVIFSPLTYEGEYGEVVTESKEVSVRSLGTRPSNIIGHFILVSFLLGRGPGASGGFGGG
jgi:hypothetical protein